MTNNTEQLVISQKKLNLLLGGLAIALPTVLYLGNLFIFDISDPLGSISGYYYSDMRDVFVGFLFAMGVFMISYEGYDRLDRFLSTFGGILIIIVALFPTNMPGTDRDLTANIHLLCAASFYFILMIFCIFRFTKTNPDKPMTKLKQFRNLIYYICGILILVVLVLLVLYHLDFIDLPLDNPTFWLEYVANSAFGTAWLVKGEGIFLINDDPILQMNPWEIFGFFLLVILLLGSGYMLLNIFFS